MRYSSAADLPANNNAVTLTPPNGLGEVVIYGRIGKHSDQLREIADAVVRGGVDSDGTTYPGCVIVNAEIEDLRALIDAVQSHPEAILAPAWKKGDPLPSGESLVGIPKLEVRGGRIASAACHDLAVRVMLTVSSCFTGVASFCRASFIGRTRFDGAKFEEAALFYQAIFSGKARFDGTIFAGIVRFDRTTFTSEARFSLAIFAGIVRFDRAKFAAEAQFSGASFGSNVRFDRVKFGSDAVYTGTSFARKARFEHASFASEAQFNQARFSAGASFDIASFAGPASFGGAIFAGDAWFYEVNFASRVSFKRVRFAGRASFDRVNIAGRASFEQVRFAGLASFQQVKFADQAMFTRACFAYKTLFSASSFARTVWFDESIFVGEASFRGANFAAWESGDLRAVDCSNATAEERRVLEQFDPWRAIPLWVHTTKLLVQGQRAREQNPAGNHEPRPILPRRVWSEIVFRWRVAKDLRRRHEKNAAFWRVMIAAMRKRYRHGAVGWHLVRALGRLSILNRVSLVALIVVPIVAAVFMAGRQLAKPGDVDAPGWVRWINKSVGVEKMQEQIVTLHLSATVALTFFAAVAVTIGLFLYQTFAPDTIKMRDEDEHVRDVEERYSDQNTSLRRDGLRRAIERLEDQATVRFGRHPRFVKHHGELIWIPPANKPEWFEDEDLPDYFAVRTKAEATVRQVREECGLPVDEAAIKEAMKKTPGVFKARAPKDRTGFVPGVERARICIEEGARAEYWLKARENIGWAWASLLFYLLGIGVLLVILAIQCRSVALATWWPAELPALKAEAAGDTQLMPGVTR